MYPIIVRSYIPVPFAYSVRWGEGTGLESRKVAESRWHPAVLNRVGSETRPNVLYYLAGIRMHGW